MTTREDLENKENVIGTALGPENGDGDEVIIAFVTQKLSEDQLDDADVVDRAAVDKNRLLRTDVQEVGEIGFESAHQEKHRPAPGGVSFGSDATGAGTMGSPLLYHEGDPVVLTNSHVAANRGRNTDSQYQPAWNDGGLRDDDPFGELKETSGHDASDENRSDSAVVHVDPEMLRDDVLGIGRLDGFAEPAYDREYTKSGRTTGVTTGELTARDGRIYIGDGDDPYVGLDVYSDMSTNGDSGSLIGYIDDKESGGFQATSLLFAGSSRRTIGIPLSQVQEVHGTFEIPDTGDGDDDGDAGDGGNDDGVDAIAYWLVYHHLNRLRTVLNNLTDNKAN